MSDTVKTDHSGHRQRLRKACRENGLLSFSPHEVIELMLYPALPRRDVNALAHRIDGALGGVSGLIQADDRQIDALGLSENVSGALKAYRDCVRVYLNAGSEDTRFINTRGELERLAEEARCESGPKLVLLSAAREIVFRCALPETGRKRFIVERALSCDAAECVVIDDPNASIPENEKQETAEALKLIDVKIQWI